jgi:hypothetical protein
MKSNNSERDGRVTVAQELLAEVQTIGNSDNHKPRVLELGESKQALDEAHGMLACQLELIEDNYAHALQLQNDQKVAKPL